jgi:hypothetical protein
MRGVVFADLDGQPGLEVVYSTQPDFPPSCEEGRIYVWDASGTLLPGFPVTTEGGAFFAPSVDDLDGDGDQEIVQVTVAPGSLARLYVIDHQGRVVAGFPQVIDGGASIADGASLYDLDHDHDLEIVYASDYALHVFEIDGSEWSEGWPFNLSAAAHGTPAIGDVDGDGEAEIFVTESDRLHLLETDGSELDGWPRTISGALFAPLSSAALGDLDGDGDLEAVVGTWMDGRTRVEVHAFHHDGSDVVGWPQTAGDGHTECPPVITDLEGDGELEVLIGGRAEEVQDDGSTSYSTRIYAWTAAGTVKAGFPWQAPDYAGDVTMVTVVDIDGDGLMEVFADAMLAGIEGQGYIFGVDATGATLPDFPLRPVGSTDLNGAVFADLDGDGDLELGSVSLDNGDNWKVWINVYDLPQPMGSMSHAWPTFHSANRRGGLYRSMYSDWEVVYVDSGQTSCVQ